MAKEDTDVSTLEENSTDMISFGIIANAWKF